MVSNISNATNIQNLADFFSFANEVTKNLFVGAVMISLAFIIFFSLKSRMEAVEAITTTCFICTILSILLRVIGMLNIGLVFIFGIGTAFGALYLYATKN